MTDQPEFTLKQIVWGKVSEYPWWPARVHPSIYCVGGEDIERTR